ncbi:hypothetical protein GCM10009601_49450 [Streptomyces thermospinosisporus]|uniref:Uncharacterized protein n=1 Tax=Streptomyces thermospinosisporus TaxID=161482 RepID=A0ABN1Z5P9_9ACTN
MPVTCVKPRVRTRKGRTPGGVQPTGCGPWAVTSPDQGLRLCQTAIATSASPPFWATTVRSAVAPGTSARTVHVPSAA